MGDVTFIEFGIILQLIKVERRAVHHFVFSSEVMDQRSFHDTKTAHLHIGRHVGDGGELEIILAIGAHLHKSQLQEAMRRVVEGILEHGEVGTLGIADW